MTEIFKGTTDVTRYVMMVDSATGAPETGLTITNFDLQYTRNRSTPAAKVDATALAATDTAHTDNRAIEVDATSSPGLYRVDWPDAAFATGADKVMLVVTCTGCAPAVEHIDLVNVNGQVAYVPNAAADAAGGLPISDAGGLDLDSKLANTNEVTSARMGALTDWIDGGRLDLLLDAVKAKTDNLPADPADASDIAAAIAALNDLSAAEVNAEVVDALATDTYAEPTGVPAATATLAAKLNVLYMIARNGVTVTSTKKQYLDDAGAAEFEKDLSDDGTTYAETKANAP